jgi:hypothetical protein
LSYFDPISASEAEIAFEPLQAHPLGSFPGFFSGVFVDVAGEVLLPISLAVVDFSAAAGVDGASFFAASLYESLR